MLPDLVNVPERKEEFMSIRYTEIIPVLTKAIQEQQAEISALKSRLNELGGLSEKLASLEAKLEAAAQSTSSAQATFNP